MAMERVPYLVGGGFEHSAEVMRSMLAASTSGAEGIITPGDFKVLQLSVPGTSVRVMPGNALIRNSYAGGAAQSYAVRAPSQTEVPIQATGSAAARTDLIIARIDDPTYQGATFDPATFEAAQFEVIKGVSASQTGVAGLDLDYPAIALARVNIPKSTGTITSAMITDLREVALPRTARFLFTHGLTGEEVDKLNLAEGLGEGEAWPNFWWSVKVPEWAQRVRVVGMWGQVRVEQKSPNNYGKVWAQIGPVLDGGFRTQQVNWDIPVSGGIARQTWMVADDRSVPAATRGTVMPVYLRGSAANQNGNYPQLDSVSSISLDLEFYETAV